MKKISNLCLILDTLNIEIIRRITERIERLSGIEILKHPQTSLLLWNGQEAAAAREVVSCRQSAAAKALCFRPADPPEIMVTQCVVTVDRVVGHGLAVGDTLEKAYCFAVIDAALAGNHRIAGEIGKIIRQQEIFLEEKNQCPAGFQMMAGTPYNLKTGYHPFLIKPRY